MLKQKLKLRTQTKHGTPCKADKPNPTELSLSNKNCVSGASPFFQTPIWMQFFCLEQELNESIRQKQPTPDITHTYNPIEYAQKIHVEYLKKYMTGVKQVMLIGMNPGPNGMGQTGVC